MHITLLLHNMNVGCTKDFYVTRAGKKTLTFDKNSFLTRVFCDPLNSDGILVLFYLFFTLGKHTL